MKSLYLTAILPPDELIQQIDEIRKDCALRFNVRAALKPPVHITLFKPVKLEEEREYELVEVLNDLKKAHSPFKVELENFDTFRTHVVFINVMTSLGLSNLESHIKHEYDQHDIAPFNIHNQKDFHPHITIAFRDISSLVFPELWSVYKNKEYRACFTVDHFTLLKHNGLKWVHFKHFELMKTVEH